MKYYRYIILLSIIFACNNPAGKQENKEKDYCSLIHRNDSLSLDTELAPLRDQMANKTGVYVLEDGGTAMLTRAWLCEYAQKTIDVQYFIFSTDNVGLIACDYLVRAADRGVKVRVLIDDMMVDAALEDVLILDSHENIEVKIYNPGVNLGKNIVQKVKKFAFDFHDANQRMHNKTFTVDGKVVITGGRNVADEYFDYDHEYNFRDRDILLIGKGTEQVQTSFSNFWVNKLSVPVRKLDSSIAVNNTDVHRFDKLHQYACNPENFWPQIREKMKELPKAFKKIQDEGSLVWVDNISFVSDQPGKNDGTNGLHGGGLSTDTIVALVNKAQKSLDIQSPYLIVTNEGIELFKKTVKRGVTIRILTNSLASTDNMEAFAGYQKCRKELLEAGVKIFEFKPDAKERYQIMTGELQKKIDFTPVFGLHAKSMVVDVTTTVIGTFNIDPRSANLNTECVTIVRDSTIANGVLKGMEEEFKHENSWETTLESNPDDKVGLMKRAKTFSKKVIPQDIL